MNRWRLLIIGLLIAFGSSAQKITGIETKLITSDKEGQDGTYSSVQFDENGNVTTLKTPWVRSYLPVNITSAENLPLVLLAIDLGVAQFPLVHGADWMSLYRTAILGDCQEHPDCLISMNMDLDQVRMISTTKQEMIEEIFDKFNDPNTKELSEIVAKHHLSYNADGAIKQLKYERIESNVLSAALLNQFVYTNDGELVQYMTADINSSVRNNFSFIKESDQLTGIAWATWNEKKGKWNRASRVSLRHDSETNLLQSVTYTDIKGRQLYVQEFIYSYD